eukprot:SAG31_NODE_724_length_12555_cov_11.624277_5_plen_96_part_00
MVASLQTITATLFRVPQCYELGAHTYHEEDFSVLCDSTKYYLIYAISLVLIVVSGDSSFAGLLPSQLFAITEILKNKVTQCGRRSQSACQWRYCS